ncbi:Nudix hydrolase 19, chloroplastic [Apostasia shenzhenica]|uniref:NAD(+) diphosphatase n=1 Tax=Apostasia shenzhenica TaxID=1088818 RepID=A0A2I0AE55_9ASPA|nr:Nudix hydrolase 19, chloroplastic [Apostasia shenzhenica]
MLLRPLKSLTLIVKQAIPNPPSRRSQAYFSPAMAIYLKAHAFAGNPLKSTKLAQSPGIHNPVSALESLKSILLAVAVEDSSSDVRVLPFRNGRPLARSSDPVGDSSPAWHLGWVPPSELKEVPLDSFVYLGLGEGKDGAYWAVDVTEAAATSPLSSGRGGACFVELRTLMVATDWADDDAMQELAIAGHVFSSLSLSLCPSLPPSARALLEWNSTSRFCGRCGSITTSINAGRQKQCTKESCKRKIYPRVDPVVIMLVIDKENDRALLSRQSRFVPRMWSCLAGFIEPGESLEEAVRRETREETGIEVGEVVYHSSQPWPDAQWHSREDVKKALKFTEYEKAQRTSAIKVNQMCKGVEKGQNFSLDFNVESGELAPMFIPGPFAIAHHLISSWVHQTAFGEPATTSKQPNSASNL